MESWEFNIRWKQTMFLFGTQIGFLALMLWVGRFSITFLPEGAGVVIPLASCMILLMIFLFCVGLFTDIKMDEASILVFLGPIVSIPLFVFSEYILLGEQTLFEAVFAAFLGVMLFLASAMPVPLFVSIMFGTSLRDRKEVGTTLWDFFTKGKALFLAGSIASIIIIIYQVNHLLFPGKDPVFVLGESILFLMIFLALLTMPLNEKLAISVGGAVAATIILAVARIPLAHMVPLLVAAPILVYLADALELNPSKIRSLPIIAAIGILLSAFTISYLFAYFMISERAIFFLLVGTGGTAALITIWQNLDLEEGIAVASVVSLGLTAELLIEGFLPRYEQLTHEDSANLIIGHLFLPFFGLILLFMLLGKTFRQDVLYLATDGHRLANRGERALDDWLTSHGLSHEANPRIDDSLSLSFLVKNGNKEYYIQYWPDLQGAEDVAQHQEFQKKLAEKRLDVDFVFGLGSLDSRLAYILKGETKTSQLSVAPAEKPSNEMLATKESPSQKDRAPFESFWRQKDRQTAS